MLQVSGQKDPIIRLVRELQNIEGRIKHARYFAEGEKLVRRAFYYGAPVEAVVIADKFATTETGAYIRQLAQEANVDCYVSGIGLLSKVLDAKPVPECLAVIKRETSELSEIFASEKLVFVIESCENADNLGMLIRCADAVGVAGIVLAGESVEPFNRKTVRGSRGTVFTVPICIEQQIERVIEASHNANYAVVSGSANCELVYTQVEMSAKTAIAVGNEHTGISDMLRRGSDAVVKIPMLGRVNSLNIATAASALMYEYMRQQRRV